ncbi:PqqD family protein [Streptomyces sp. ISL-100]|uniref:PqqD family protein n=1 Tax=Streptomyces sp. ISL-100 TaxID=2819173 RepID=UPI001BEC24D9|nr:PqqD family protein [Streptomyces sp. ISL-100]MBT2395733.1 PqqD family protein [Streptomyces sp. ISL-100]
MTPDSVPVPRLDVRFRNIRGQVLIARGEDALELTEAAAFVFRRIDGTRTVRRIGEELAAEYGIGADEAVTDAGDVLTHLAEAGFIGVEAPSS